MKILKTVFTSLLLTLLLSTSAIAHNDSIDVELLRERSTLTGTVNTTEADLVLGNVGFAGDHDFVELHILLKAVIEGAASQNIAISIVDKQSTVGGLNKPLIARSVRNDSVNNDALIAIVRVKLTNGMPQLALRVATLNSVLTGNVKITYRIYATRLIDS